MKCEQEVHTTSSSVLRRRDIGAATTFTDKLTPRRRFLGDQALLLANVLTFSDFVRPTLPLQPPI